MAEPGLFDLRGQVALVTGATGGLGRALCLQLSAHGADVAVVDLDAERCEALAFDIQSISNLCTPV